MARKQAEVVPILDDGKGKANREIIDLDLKEINLLWNQSKNQT